MSNQQKKRKLKSRTGLDYDFKSTKFFERRAKYGDKHAKAHVDHMRGPDYKGRGNVPGFGGPEDNYETVDKIRAKS